MLERLRRLCRSSTLVMATLFLLAAIYFGSTRDLADLLISIPVLAVLLLATLIAAALSWLRSKQRGEGVVAAVLIGLALFAYSVAYDIKQSIRFMIWAPSHHRELEQASRKDGLIIGWDSWGMAGQDSFSYLAVDTQDRLASNARAAEWTRQIGQTCKLWQAHRVWPKLYIVTPDTNCPYDGVAPAG